MESANSHLKTSGWAPRMMVAIPFLCFWGALDATRGSDHGQSTAGWIFPILIAASLIGIGAQLRAARGRWRDSSALAGQFVMGMLLTTVAVVPLWSPANLAAVRHAYQTIPPALVLPPLTLVALANALTLHVALRRQPFSWHPPLNPRRTMVAGSAVALAVALACALGVAGALATDPSWLLSNLQWGGLVVVAVAFVQLAVSARVAFGGARTHGPPGAG